MAFPTTSVLDTFNRADENPLSFAGKWSQVTPFDSNDLKLVSNQCLDTGAGFGARYWNVASFADAEVYVTVPTLPANTESITLFARANSADLTNFPSYALAMTKASGTDSWQLIRNDVGSSANLGAAFAQEVAAGDSFGMSVVGTTATIYYKAAAGAWTSLGTRTDATYATGKIALEMQNTTARADDFGGGTVVSGASPVLQDLGHRPGFMPVLAM